MKLNSYLETIIYDKIYELFDDSLIEKIEVNEYYDWIINPHTKKNLQLDFLIYFKEKIDYEVNGESIRKDAMLAIEVQGQQHYHEVKEFHKKKNDLKRQQIRDSIKLRSCRNLGIPLIRLKYNKITWKMNLEKLILTQLDQFKKDNDFGIKNRNYLIEYISTLSKFNYGLTKIDKNILFERNEWSKFLKND
jgi:hypothetical protein